MKRFGRKISNLPQLYYSWTKQTLKMYYEYQFLRKIFEKMYFMTQPQIHKIKSNRITRRNKHINSH